MATQPERLNMAETPPGVTGEPGSSGSIEQPRRFITSNFDLNRRDYKTRVMGNYVSWVDPQTGIEVARMPKIEGGAGGPAWLEEAVEERPSTFETALELRNTLAKVNRNNLPVDPAQGMDRRSEFDQLVATNNQEIDRLITEAQNRGVLDYFYRDVSNLYREITAEPVVSRYGEETSRRIMLAERIEMSRKALRDYQETFWEYNEPALGGLQQSYRGVAVFIARRVAIAIEKDLKGIPLSAGEIGDRLVNLIKQDIEREQEERKGQELERNPFWDRSWGRVVLTGRTPEGVRRGIDNFLQVATSEESNIDPQRYIEDANGLNQEVQRVGQIVGIEREEILKLVALAEGTLFVNVAQYFAVRWHVGEWHQIAALIGRHIDTRLNAITKGFDAEVMHAADILDFDEEFDKYARPARFASDLSSHNDQAAKSERDQMRRKLVTRIVLSQLKDINTVIREHFTGIENQIDGFGFDRNAQVSATELFKNSQYLAAIKAIDEKLRTYNQKWAENAPDKNDYRLEEWEKKLLDLDRIRGKSKTEDLVTMDQTYQQFRNLYSEYDGFGTQTDYDVEIQRLQQKMNNGQALDDRESRRWQKNELLKKLETGGGLTEDEHRQFPDINRALRAVDLAIKTRDVFFISAEKSCASLVTRHSIGQDQGELLSYNDVLRFNKFVRERAIASLPENVAKAITAATRGGQGLRYVDIADKLEFRAIAQKTLNDRGEKTTEGQNAKEALILITLTQEEKQWEKYVQAVEDVQEKVLEKLKERGSEIAVADIDTIITQTFQNQHIQIDANSQDKVAKRTKVIHRGETEIRPSQTYHDIVNRDDADPQYNLYMADDQKYSSLLLSDEIRAAAYNSDHPYYNTVPARVRRVLDPDQNLIRKLDLKLDPDLARVDLFRAMERQRRFHFAVDAVKVFGAFYRPDPYTDKEVVVEYVENIRNSPFIARRMIEQRFWTLWNRGQAYRGRGFLKYLESNFRGLDHSVGQRGLRGVIATYTGFSHKGFSYNVDFNGGLDELKAEHWLSEAKSADAIRPVLVGGQVGQDPNFEGIFKKIVKTIGRNNYDYNQYEALTARKKWELPVLVRLAERDFEYMKGGDYEKAITEIEDRWGRITIYGNSLNFVGNVSQVPLAAKFSGDTAVRRMVYWAVAHPEAAATYNLNMDLTRAILQPLPEETDTPEGKQAYFGKGNTLFNELIRRAILVK